MTWRLITGRIIVINVEQQGSSPRPYYLGGFIMIPAALNTGVHATQSLRIPLGWSNMDDKPRLDPDVSLLLYFVSCPHFPQSAVNVRLWYAIIHGGFGCCTRNILFTYPAITIYLHWHHSIELIEPVQRNSRSRFADFMCLAWKSNFRL